MKFNKFGLGNTSIEQKEIVGKTPMFLAARVLKTILTQNDPEWKTFGEWDSIGITKWTPLYSQLKNVNASINYAKPLFPNYKQYPLEGEIIYVIQLPDPQTEESPNTSSWYYISVVNVWGSTHHNALPNISNTTDPSTYNETESGFSKNTSSTPKTKFGNTFQEKSEIKSLLPFEGDIIYEGRWGQSIRLGSTVKDQNSWSSFGDNGNPILIIRNGQPKEKTRTFNPLIEDINKDGSSLYFTDGQIIKLQGASSNFAGHPSGSFINPDKFSGKQIIGSSERIVLNGSDSIILLSNKSTTLSSENLLSFNSKDTILNSKKIQLGLNSTEPLLLGNKTVTMLKELFDKMDSLTDALGKMVFYDGTQKVATTPVNTYAQDLNRSIKEMKTKLNDLKSKQNFTL